MEATTTRRWWLDATELWTERLVLRALSPADAAALGHAMWTHRDHLTPWIDVPGIPLPEREWRHRTRRNALAFVRGVQLLYAVRRAGDDRLLGCAGLTPAGAMSELSYWLIPAATGRGYAREATAALAQLAHYYAGTSAARIRCRADNVRSAAVACALGARLTSERGGAQEWTLLPERLYTTGRVVVGRAGRHRGSCWADQARPRSYRKEEHT